MFGAVRTLGGLLANPTDTIRRLMRGRAGAPPWVRVYLPSVTAFVLPWLVWPLTGYLPGEFADYGISPGMEGYGWYLIMALSMAVFLLPAGLLLWAFASWVLGFTGRMLKGTGSHREVSNALAWAAVGGAVPSLIFMLLPAFWPATFMGDEPTNAYYALTLLQGLMVLWVYAIAVGAMCAAHGFGLIKGMITAFIGPALVTAAFAAAVLGFTTMAWLFQR